MSQHVRAETHGFRAATTNAKSDMVDYRSQIAHTNRRTKKPRDSLANVRVIHIRPGFADDAEKTRYEKNGKERHLRHTDGVGQSS